MLPAQLQAPNGTLLAAPVSTVVSVQPAIAPAHGDAATTAPLKVFLSTQAVLCTFLI